MKRTVSGLFRPKLIAALLLVCGCQSVPGPAEYDREIRAALPALLKAGSVEDAITVTHRVTATFRGETTRFMSVIEISGDDLAMVVLGDLGIPLMSIDVEGGVVQSAQNTALAIELPPEWLLFDLQLGFTSFEQIQSRLASPWRVEQRDRRRRLFYRSKLVKEVRYREPVIDAGALWSRSIELSDKALGYDLDIEVVNYEDPKAARKTLDPR